MRFPSFLVKKALMLGGLILRKKSCRLELPAQNAAANILKKKPISWMFGLTAVLPMKQFAKYAQNWLGQLICTWKAVTSIAAGSNLLC